MVVMPTEASGSKLIKPDQVYMVKIRRRFLRIFTIRPIAPVKAPRRHICMQKTMQPSIWHMNSARLDLIWYDMIKNARPTNPIV